MGTSERKARDFERREIKILKTASDLFQKKGVDSVKMEEIAEKMEVSVGTLYQHFKSKNEIYARLFIEKDLERLNHISQISPDLPVLEQLRQLYERYIQFYFENPVAYKILRSCEKRGGLDQLKPETLEKFKAQRDASLGILENLLQRGIEEGVLINVPVSYLSCAGLALAHGAIEMMTAQYFEGKISDWTNFFSFLGDVLIRSHTHPEIHPTPPNDSSKMIIS
ncbi:MAG: TetR/AcrR family transcriptional regulator [SAR324 cluster bacterium]|nr:TetR/AcrR family transcriptional regulator [SAR324 cluster bacterium]MBF0352148.1 TetR/AcrR family transcriptional regulator [SAR324 cluster bacterium]